MLRHPLAAVAVLLHLACTHAADSAPPTPDGAAGSSLDEEPRPAARRAAWPTEITFERLHISREQLSRQTFSLDPPDFDPRGRGVVARFYAGIPGPSGHGKTSGTEVYYSVEQDSFYLRSDCLEGHHDGYVGPFSGDPRTVLKK